MRKLIPLTLILVLLAGCSPIPPAPAQPSATQAAPPASPQVETTQPAPATSTPFAPPLEPSSPPPEPTLTGATASPENQAAQDTPTAVPTQPPVGSSLLTTLFDYPVRVIPPSLDPNTQFDQLVAGYQQAIQQDGLRFEWIGGASFPEFAVWLSTLSEDPDEIITLSYPIQIGIEVTNEPTGGMNLLGPNGGGGGGVINGFPELVLRPVEMELYPDEIAATDLQFGAQTDVGYIFPIRCVQPGVFRLRFSIPYTLTRLGDLSQQSLAYELLFACPETATMWIFDTENGQMLTNYPLVLRDGQYVQP